MDVKKIYFDMDGVLANFDRGVVELAKTYADDSAPVFINGILASIVKEKNLDSQDNK